MRISHRKEIWKLTFWAFALCRSESLHSDRANARNVSFRISLWWPIRIINSVDKTKFSYKNLVVCPVGLSCSSRSCYTIYILWFKTFNTTVVHLIQTAQYLKNLFSSYQLHDKALVCCYFPGVIYQVSQYMLVKSDFQFKLCLKCSKILTSLLPRLALKGEITQKCLQM